MPKVKRQLLPIIDNLKAQSLLKTYTSLYNTPVLGAQNLMGSKGGYRTLDCSFQATWWYLTSFLSQILKDVFKVTVKRYLLLCSFIYRVPVSLCLWKFSQPGPQLTWTVFPRGFRDSHLFGSVLSHNLAHFKFSQVTVLQYADDMPLRTPSEKLTKALMLC